MLRTLAAHALAWGWALYWMARAARDERAG